MELSDFDFDLPERLIALRPAEPRGASRLLVMAPGEAPADRMFADLPSLLRPGDLLVLNDTRVIAARLTGTRTREASEVAVEATLHRRLAPNRWSAFMRPGKRLRPGDRVRFGAGADRACLAGALDATMESKGEDGEVTLAFDLAGPDLDRAVEAAGVMPLPPYIAARRPEDERDRADYQTAYARAEGSVAAPTAGLHFTPDLLTALEARGVERRFVTLHVGAGTFLPVKAEWIEDHRMHAETGEVSAETAAAVTAARAQGRRVVCVGTTALRLLETATGADGITRPFAGETDIFIRPGGPPVRSADALVTNFHLPRSTLLMLLSAFAGHGAMRRGYAHAVEAGYRFYSYGDAGLWFREARG